MSQNKMINTVITVVPNDDAAIAAYFAPATIEAVIPMESDSENDFVVIYKWHHIYFVTCFVENLEVGPRELFHSYEKAEEYAYNFVV